MKRLEILFLLLAFGFASCQKDTLEADVDTGTIKVTFVPMVKTAPLVLNGPSYTNSVGESYTISRFKWYINHVIINNIDRSAEENNSYHLLDAANTSSLSFTYKARVESYNEISFQIGVDSIRNVSGAQTGALDPANDMFWTWTTGYIMAKLEGSSPVSTQPGNRIEYHIGGFSGPNSVLRNVSLKTPTGKLMQIRKDKVTEIIIAVDADAWWKNPNTISFATSPVCTTPGVLASQIAENYSKMFTITDVINF